MPQYDLKKKKVFEISSQHRQRSYILFYTYIHTTFVNDVAINGQVGNSKAPFLHKNNKLAKSIRTNFCRSLESSQNLKN